MITPINIIYSYFKKGAFPTQEQFQASWSSFWHKSEKIPIESIDTLEATLQNKLDKNVYTTHLTNVDAHSTTLAKLDASNLNAVNIGKWKTTLGVGDLPTNIATVDEGNQLGNVYLKTQSDELFMQMDDFVLPNGKIDADKIDALGITDLIQAVETTLALFAANANSPSYVFQKNDFIAIPSNGGNYSLYLFKGGEKTLVDNYLPTGLTNITIAMVEGLQVELNKKINGPTVDGSFFTRRASGITSQRAINPSPSYICYWNGNDFAASPIYTDGVRLGVATTSPTEMLHLNNGRIRTKAIVLDETTESLPFQITYDARSFYGSDSTGNRRKLMYQSYADYRDLISTFTDAQKDESRIKLRKTNETYSVNQPIINNVLPPIIDKTLPFTQYVTIIGLNLFLDTFTQGAAQIEMKNSVTGVVTMISSFTSYQYAPDRITFGLDFNGYDEGDYSFRVFHNNQWSLPNLTKVLRIRNALNTLPIPSLTWQLADETGPQTSIAGVQTTTDRVIINTTSPQKTIYAQSSDITTQQEMNDGVLLVFSVDMKMYDDISFSNLLMGFVNSVFVNNDYQDFGFSCNGLYPSGVRVIFKQSGTIKNLPNNAFAVADLVYVTIKNGVAEILFLNSGVNAIEVIPFTSPLRLKIGNKRLTADTLKVSKIDCQLINKYSLI